MKNQITLNEELTNHLRTLFNQIDEENKKPCMESNIDTITFNQYEILDTIQKLIFQEPPKKTIQCPTVTLKIHLYDIDENDNYVPMSREDAEDAIIDISHKNDVAGFSITDMTITTEEFEVPYYD